MLPLIISEHTHIARDLSLHFVKEPLRHFMKGGRLSESIYSRRILRRAHLSAPLWKFHGDCGFAYTMGKAPCGLNV